MITQEPVNLKQQTIFGFIPYLNLYAIYRIQKLRRFFVLGIAVFIVLTIIEMGIIFGIVLTEEKSELPMLGEMHRSAEVSIAHGIGGLIFSGYLTRRWSKKWNESFSNSINDETK